jgi:hypothetical protein
MFGTVVISVDSQQSTSDWDKYFWFFLSTVVTYYLGLSPAWDSYGSLWLYIDDVSRDVESLLSV